MGGSVAQFSSGRAGCALTRSHRSPARHRGTRAPESDRLHLRSAVGSPRVPADRAQPAGPAVRDRLRAFGPQQVLDTFTTGA